MASSSDAPGAAFFTPTSQMHELSLATPRTNNGLAYSYGTSGFRGLASTLPSICLRMGYLAALRSLCTSPPLTVGVMVTASHNDAPDNGVKLVDPSGSMLPPSWEDHATTLANLSEAEVAPFLRAFSLQQHIDLTSPPRVFVGRDTRASSPSLAALVVAGVRALAGEVTDFGLTTTPLLHYLVRQRNEGGEATPDVYYRTLAEAFNAALETKEGKEGASLKLPALRVDCANGVGGAAMEHFRPLIPALPLTLVNTATSSHLNEQCGAEHVQKTRTLPSTASSPAPPPQPGDRLCSLDGDADRLVYYFLDSQSRVRLLDGDKLLVLYCTFVSSLLRQANMDGLSVGIVQTAYANGASTRYMRETLHIEPVCAATGVKHLHGVAEGYDVGLYFEANGHGTVLFKEQLHAAFRKAAKQEGAEGRAGRCLLSLVLLVNQCVGDAVSDLLLTEVALHHLDWSLQTWDAAYEDLPSAMLKVKVKDRTVITTTDAERRCVTPPGLQEAIDELVQGGKGGGAGVRRAFVRPSGTEDVVRVYAEAETRQEVDVLAKQVCEAVFKHAGGVQ